jgi:hypothetical protein
MEEKLEEKKEIVTPEQSYLAETDDDTSKDEEEEEEQIETFNLDTDKVTTPPYEKDNDELLDEAVENLKKAAKKKISERILFHKKEIETAQENLKNDLEKIKQNNEEKSREALYEVFKNTAPIYVTYLSIFCQEYLACEKEISNIKNDLSKNITLQEDTELKNSIQEELNAVFTVPDNIQVALGRLLNLNEVHTYISTEIPPLKTEEKLKEIINIITCCKQLEKGNKTRWKDSAESFCNQYGDTGYVFKAPAKKGFFSGLFNSIPESVQEDPKKIEFKNQITKKYITNLFLPAKNIRTLEAPNNPLFPKKIST